jgi:hypothetical protein
VAEDLSLLKRTRCVHIFRRVSRREFQRNQCLTITVTTRVALVGLASWGIAITLIDPIEEF